MVDEKQQYAQIRYYSKRKKQLNDNINIDSTIACSMNNRR